MQQTFPRVSISVSTFHLQYNLIQTPCANAVVTPNLYIWYALNQKAHLSSKTSKKICFLLHKIYTSSIYIIHVLQSTLGFRDGSGVTQAQNGVPLFDSEPSLQCKCKSITSTTASSQSLENVPGIMHKAVINNKVDLLNAFKYYIFPTEAYLKYQQATL